MRKTVKNTEGLRKLALEKGVEVTDSRGRKFNTAKATATQRPKPAPKPAAPPPPPEPPKPIMLDTAQLERVVENMAAGVANSTELMRDVAAQMAAQTARIIKAGGKVNSGWIFDVRRDDEGFIEQIIATPRRLN